VKNTLQTLTSKEIAMIKQYLTSKSFTINFAKYVMKHTWALGLTVFLFALVFTLGMIYVPQIVALLTLLWFVE